MHDSLGCLMCRGQTPPPGRACKTCGRKGVEKPHECHAIGCSKSVPPKMLMCSAHWALVPRELQRQVWSAYVPGQEVKKNPTPMYLDIMQQAIRAVARKEGRDVR